MTLNFCTEQKKDYYKVYYLIKEAFKSDPNSGHNEQDLVVLLRKSDKFIPELSITAKEGERVVGYILLSPIEIINRENANSALVLAPLVVDPNYQNQGIGSKLINFAHSRAIQAGYNSIAVIGHENYYPKFGYELASKYSISFPFETPDVYCMIKELTPRALNNVYGMVAYPEAFYQYQ